MAAGLGRISAFDVCPGKLFRTTVHVEDLHHDQVQRCNGIVVPDIFPTYVPENLARLNRPGTFQSGLGLAGDGTALGILHRVVGDHIKVDVFDGFLRVILKDNLYTGTARAVGTWLPCIQILVTKLQISQNNHTTAPPQ